MVKKKKEETIPREEPQEKKKKRKGSLWQDAQKSLEEAAKYIKIGYEQVSSKTEELLKPEKLAQTKEKIKTGYTTIIGRTEEARKYLKTGFETVSKRTEELSTLGRFKVDTFSLNREIAKTIGDLGGMVYQLIHEENATDIVANPKVKELVKRITGLEKKLTTLQAKEKEFKARKKA
ncbi:unnamed protein product [marine sediment metagenome]|uniref:Uncharacterized protein n=1 Tax=marine sediment metagenome TaxID=412755 RepID=X1M124_9ZZZZ